MEPKIIVKKGDSLGLIAKRNNISVEALARLNKISDPNKISVGQELLLSPPSSVEQKPTVASLMATLLPTTIEAPKTPTNSTYTVKSGDTLGRIAKNFDISVTELAEYNSVSDINRIALGAKIKIPGNKATKFSEEGLQKAAKKATIYGDKKLYQGFDESKIDNKQVVLDNLKGKEPFVMVDKRTNTLTRYDKDGNVLSTMRVGVGKDKGDKFTINSKNKNVDRNTTPGGVYEVDAQGKNESYKHTYDDNILLLKNQSGMRQATAVHQVPEHDRSGREAKLRDTNPNNDNFSNGCINCTKADYLKYLKDVEAGSKVVILPEEEGNYFTDTSGKLAFTTNRNKEYGQYNYTPKDQEAQPFSYTTTKPTETKTKYLNALKHEKENLMRDLNLSNEEYDTLAKRAYGILGQESNFGEGSWNPAHDYRVEELYTNLFDSPEQRRTRSLGLSQIRMKNVNPEFAKKYGIDEKSLFYPYQAAVATMERLADAHQAVKNPRVRDQYPDATPENIYDYSTTFYNKPNAVRKGQASGSNTYVQAVKKYSNELVPVEYLPTNPIVSNTK